VDGGTGAVLPSPAQTHPAALKVLLADPVSDAPERGGDPSSVRQSVGASLDTWSKRFHGEPLLLVDPLRRWRRLVASGRADAVLGRLFEGHADAWVIATESGHALQYGARYGVWASQSGKTGVTARPHGTGWLIDGRMRFCSGANILDRALVTARTESGDVLLVDLDLARPGVAPIAGTWPAVGMDASDSGDVRVDGVAVEQPIGGPGFYLDRPGFPIGGIGVAAVWWGAAYGLFEAAVSALGEETTEAQYAHIGALTVAFEVTAALLVDTARCLPVLDRGGLEQRALVCRSAVDALVEDVVRRVPRITGPVPLTHDAAIAHRLADLPIYVRQHHAERDLTALGRLSGLRDGRC